MDNFTNFYKLQKKKLFSYLVRITGDYQLSMDIMQESFTRYLEKYRNEKDNILLLYTIARNVMYDNRRRNKIRRSSDQYQGDYQVDQEHNFQIKQEYRQVLMAMENLEEDEREILALALNEDLRYREIATIMKISEGNVKVKVHRARMKLKKMLQDGGMS